MDAKPNASFEDFNRKDTSRLRTILRVEGDSRSLMFIFSRLPHSNPVLVRCM